MLAFIGRTIIMSARTETKLSTRQSSNSVLFLSESDVRRCLPISDCIAANRVALTSIATDTSFDKGGDNDKVIIPTRTKIPYQGDADNTDAPTDFTLFKPAAYISNRNCLNVMGMKLVSVRSNNYIKFGKPTVPASIMLMDSETGEVKSYLGGTYLTASRTAAASAIATEYILQQKLKTTDTYSNLVVFGAGLQIELHIHAILNILTNMKQRIRNITIVNRSPDRAIDLRQSILSSLLSPEQCKVNVILLKETENIKTALEKSNIIVTATNSSTPIFDENLWRYIPPGCHVNGVGSYTPEMEEVDSQFIASRCHHVLIDTIEALTVGDLKHMNGKNRKVVDLLGNVILQKKLSPPSTGQKDCTFFKSVGTAIQDVITAHQVVKNAQKMGVGTYFEMN